MRPWMTTAAVLLTLGAIAVNCFASDPVADKQVFGTWECNDDAGHQRITYKDNGRFKLIDLTRKQKPRFGHYTYTDKAKVLLEVEVIERHFYNVAWKGKDQFTATEVKTKKSRVWKRVDETQ